MTTRNRILGILCCALWGLLLTGCDSKWDENGDLDGMWQLTEWRDKGTDQVVKTQEDGIYYCVQLNLLKFQEGSQAAHYLAYFTHSDAALLVGQTTEWPSDEVRPLTELARFGVPADGRFHIDALSRKRMVLSTPEATLTFRKY